MTPEHDHQLRTRYPHLYAGRFYNDEPFRCGDGWVCLIDRLSAWLDGYILAMPEPERGSYRAVQVKEKFGTLRFYMSKGTEAMSEAIRAAEDESARTCEHCGKPGILRGQGWVRTLCDECHDVTEREKAEPKP